MSFKVFLCCFLLLYILEVVPACRQGPLMNLCDDSRKDYNATETEDAEALCDCQNLVFCTVLSYTQECNSTTVQLSFSENATFFSQVNCEMSSLDKQKAIPRLEVLNRTGNELSVKFSADSFLGLSRIFCTATESSCSAAESCTAQNFNETSSEWEILDVSPMEVLADSEVELHLTLNKNEDRHNSSPAWCFINTPDNNTEILSAVKMSANQITCSGFSPVIPGLFTISLRSEFAPYNAKKSINVTAKRPMAQKAAYDFHFKTIYIYFDTNVELYSNCGSAFSKTFGRYFDKVLKCYTRGNIIQIKTNERFREINDITINPDNKICSEGSVQSGLCLSALPAKLTISKPKVLGPSLSFYISDECADNKTQKYMNVKVINSDHRTDAFQNQTLQNGKSQRRNLIIWRGMRRIQSKFSSRLFFQLNKTDMLPFIENLSAFENILDVSGDNLGSSVRVTVYVQSSPSSSNLLAEAHVSFCKDYGELFRYKWVVNGKNLSEDGRLLILRDLSPGKYLIKCVVVGYNSTEILGQGWSIAEVFENAEEIFIIPSELAAGVADDISLRAVTLHGNSVSWTCRTALGKLCLTKDRKMLSEVYNFNSPNISIPAGTLPVGNYVWTAESSGMTNMAKVFIRPGDMTVNVDIPSVFVNTFLDVILNGSLLRVREKCRAGWSSVRKKGFTYLDLSTFGVKEIAVEESPKVEIPATIFSSALLPDSLYLFKLQLFCPQSNSVRFVKVPLRASAPPTVSSINVQPLEGKAMITKFEVTGAEAEDCVQDYPLVYEWSYIDPCDVEIPLGSGLSAKNFATYLPPGDVKIMAKVCNGKKICSTRVSPTITVTQSAEVQKENFDKTLNRMQYLMSSGDVSEAFGLAATMFKSLALIAEFEIRGKLLTAVEEAINLKINDLTEKLLNDPTAVKSSVEFSGKAEIVAKYFQKSSAIISRLMDFKKTLKNF